jgi:hypothetical protein
MRTLGRRNLRDVGPGFRIACLWTVTRVIFAFAVVELPFVFVGGLSTLAGVPGSVTGSVLGVTGSVLGVTSAVRGRRRHSQAPTGLRTVISPAPKTLRFVGGLLPGDEGTAWVAEVGSCLAEARDQSERRRYVRSYLRNVPQLVWTSWAVRLGASRRRELL